MLVFICGALVFSCGCRTLAKKFTREKKQQTETPVYVNVKEYPAIAASETYNEYYFFIKGWLSELVDVFNDGSNAKRAKWAVDEAIEDFGQISGFYNDAGKEAIKPLYDEMLAMKQELEKNDFTNNVFRHNLSQRTDKVLRDFQRMFSYEDVSGWLAAN